MTNEQKSASLFEQLNSRKYNPDYIPPADRRIFTIRGKLIASLQNYVIISGLPKSGKSTFISAVIASGIHPADIFNMKLNLLDKRRKLCYIDTESSDYDYWRTMERIKGLTGFSRLPKNFDSYSVREDDHLTLKAYVEIYLEKNKDCSCIILDGLLDFILNFNDEVESRKFVQWLKFITKKFDCLVIGILHLGKKDGATLGHLGSATDRYAVATLEVIKDKEQKTFMLQSRFMRSDEDFEPVCIKNFEGVFHEIAYEPTLQQQFKNPKKNK